MEGDTERKTGGFESESSHSKWSSLKKRPVVATKVIHLLIALMCHIFYSSLKWCCRKRQGDRHRAQGREGVFQILACGQTIFPLGGVSPIQGDLNSPTLKYLVNEWEKAPSQSGEGGVSTQCGRPPSIFLMILIKELRRDHGTWGLPLSGDERAGWGWRATDMNVPPHPPPNSPLTSTLGL